MEIRVLQYFMAVARHENTTKARAQEILSLTEKTKEQFAKRDEFVAGDIYIGAGKTQAMAYVAKVLAPLLSSHPALSGQRQ